MPGVGLSPPVSSTSPSTPWPSAISSIESATTSRLGSTYFMLRAANASLSVTWNVLNSRGVPPPIRTPALTASTTWRRWAFSGEKSW